jgi:heme oxygenase
MGKPTSRRAHLAGATADIHEALHGAAPFARIAQGRIGAAGYGALLQLLLRYHSGMAGICETGAQHLGIPQLAAAHRARIARLEQDLDFLNHSPVAAIGEPARDSAFAVGCLYTVLGSTLGGKVISRQLESVLPDGRGRSFFAGSTDDARYWRLFCERLEALDFPQAAVEAGARYAFARFAALMEDWSDTDVTPWPASRGGGGDRWFSSPQIG